MASHPFVYGGNLQLPWGLIFLIGLWRPLEREVRSLNECVPPFPEQEWSTVDVFITCYNEPVEMVEETARAALALQYPTTKLRVYILDDGNNPEMRAMADHLCLEDLRSAKVQAEAWRLRQRRARLGDRHEALTRLAPTLQAADHLLNRFHLRVPSEPSALSKVLTWFDGLYRPSIPYPVWLEVKTVLAEGFTNAVHHAHHDLPASTPIDLEVLQLQDCLGIRIWDRGTFFDLERRLQLQPAEIDVQAEGGRGLLIMKRLTDYLGYNRVSDRRNSLLMLRRFAPVDASNPDLASHAAHELEQVAATLQGMQEFLRWVAPGEITLTDRLQIELRTTLQDMHQVELAQSELARCRYLARPKPSGVPHHAKAGNINYAIFAGETQGQLIVTLDADHIPKPQFLQRVLPYFYDYNPQTATYRPNRIAFVQTPQDFYNMPPGDPFGHRAHLFYGPIQQGKDGLNAAFYTGTNAILRREALVGVGLRYFTEEYLNDAKRLDEFDLVGGVSSNSITEDMNTAMRLHAAGWQSVYHNELLAEGLAPDDLSSTLKQRLRWAQGTIQVLQKENPLTKPGLGFWQRLQYFQTMYSYFSGFASLVFLVCPLIFFFTGVIPVQSYGLDFALYFVPAFICNRLTFMIAAWGVPAGELWRSEQFAIALFPLFIRSVWSVFTRQPLKFQVTPKQRQSGRYLGLIRPQLTFVILTILGLSWSLYRFATGQLTDPWIHVLNAGWAIYNLSLLWAIVRAAVWQPPVPPSPVPPATGSTTPHTASS